MKRVFGLLVCIALTRVGVVVAAENDALIAEGRKQYLAHCARCHGPEAKGDGIDAKRLPVVPRDLTSGVYKFRTTASGTPPSDADLRRVIDRGLGGSGMPSFGNLSASAKDALIAYLKSLNDDFTAYTPQPIAPPDTRIKANLVKGAEVYSTLQCALCHGVDGRANGTSAATLTDVWGRHLPPADLTQGWKYRAGSSPEDIYYRLMAGLNGTPMPSYEGAVTTDDAWQLAHYVASMQLKPNWDHIVHVQSTEGELPTAVDDPAWKDVPRTDANVQGMFYSGGRRLFPTAQGVSIQAVHNDAGIAYRVQWNDPTRSEKAPYDSVLLAFKPEPFGGNARGNLYNMYPPDSAVLDINRWSARTPEAMDQGIANMHTATRPDWKPAQRLPSAAVYDDGRWAVVFARPYEQKATGGADREPVVAVAVWDGDNDESGFHRASSQWLTLSFGENPIQH